MDLEEGTDDENVNNKSQKRKSKAKSGKLFIIDEAEVDDEVEEEDEWEEGADEVEIIQSDSQDPGPSVRETEVHQRCVLE